MLYLLLFVFIHVSVAKEWIDPHDMDSTDMYKVSTSKVVIPPDPAVNEGNTSQYAKDDITLAHLKRIVSLLLSAASPNQDDESILNGKYFFNKEGKDYEFLLKFINMEKIEPNDLRQLDRILNAAFSKSYTENILNKLNSINYFFIYLFNSQVIILLIACMALLIFFYLLRSNFSFWYIFNYFFFIIWIVDYAIRYQKLLEQTDIHNIGVMSEECKNRSWFDYLFKAGEKCEQKTITPIEVALLQLKHIIIIPMSAFGTGTGKFMKELWSELPFPYNIVMFPFLLLLILILVPAIMTIINGRSFKINIMHLFHVQFGSQDEPLQEINKLAQLLSMNQRASTMNSPLHSTFKVIKGNREKKNNSKNRRWNKNFTNVGQEKHLKNIKSKQELT